jgi:hypothetical protein
MYFTNQVGPGGGEQLFCSLQNCRLCSFNVYLDYIRDRVATDEIVECYARNSRAGGYSWLIHYYVGIAVPPVLIGGIHTDVSRVREYNRLDKLDPGTQSVDVSVPPDRFRIVIVGLEHKRGRAPFGSQETVKPDAASHVI